MKAKDRGNRTNSVPWELDIASFDSYFQQLRVHDSTSAKYYSRTQVINPSGPQYSLLGEHLFF